MTKENAGNPGDPIYDQNRALSQAIIDTYRKIKEPNLKPGQEGRFVIQWRMFANANYPDINKSLPDQCGCGCSCGCA
jgi:hypothetical protein